MGFKKKKRVTFDANVDWEIWLITPAFGIVIENGLAISLAWLCGIVTIEFNKK